MKLGRLAFGAALLSASLCRAMPYPQQVTVTMPDASGIGTVPMQLDGTWYSGSAGGWEVGLKCDPLRLSVWDGSGDQYNASLIGLPPYNVLRVAVTRDDFGWGSKGLAFTAGGVPEPGSIAILGVAGIFLLRRGSRAL